MTLKHSAIIPWRVGDKTLAGISRCKLLLSSTSGCRDRAQVWEYTHRYMHTHVHTHIDTDVHRHVRRGTHVCAMCMTRNAQRHVHTCMLTHGPGPGRQQTLHLPQKSSEQHPVSLKSQSSRKLWLFLS